MCSLRWLHITIVMCLGASELARLLFNFFSPTKCEGGHDDKAVILWCWQGVGLLGGTQSPDNKFVKKCTKAEWIGERGGAWQERIHGAVVIENGHRNMGKDNCLPCSN